MLSAFAAYLGLHVLAYVLLFRHSARLRSERGIFLYHLVPAAATGLAALAYTLAVPGRLPELVLVVSVHGIYSISTLWLWSLAQGGYSLAVLRSVARAETTRVEPDFSQLEQIGETKQRERIAALEALGLVAVRDRTIVLTRRGRRIAFLLDCQLKWIDPRFQVGGPA
jgi:hypothetical protein